MTTWNETTIQQYIDGEIEENHRLDYKAADSLGKSDGKKKEITKDVSAFANSDGGLIIYGVAEYQGKVNKHLPEKIDPIDRTTISKEWLDNVISNIRPRINGVVVHPVSLSSESNKVVYVVEIPKSTTAHQATDKRYYKRFNFKSEPMYDYEIRDVMNRSKGANLHLEWGEIKGSYTPSFWDMLILNAKVTSLNDISSEYGYLKFFAAYPFRISAYGQSRISIEKSGLQLQGYTNIPTAQVAKLYWHMQSGGIIFPDDWYNLSGIRLDLPPSITTKSLTFLIQTELFTAFSPVKKDLHAITFDANNKPTIILVTKNNYSNIIDQYFATSCIFQKS